MRVPAGFAAAALIFLIAVLPGACSPPSDETLLRQYIDEGVAALNDRDRSAALQHVRPGLMVKGDGLAIDANRLMLIYFQRFKQVHVFVYDVSVSIENARAEVRFNAVLLGSNQVLPENANIFEVVSQWEKDDDWWLSDIRWQRKLIELPPEVRDWFRDREPAE